MEKIYKIGDIVRADKLGLTGRDYLHYCICKTCNQNKWVRKSYVLNFECRNCKSRNTINDKKMNSYIHLEDCKCQRCKIGKGCLKGKNNHMWKGGKKTTKSGYVYVYLENDSKFISMCAKGIGTNYVAEHRLVMANKINRVLLKNETVHHINGIRDDNRIENLELWSSNHQSGQRLEDQIKWAIELLQINNYKIVKL
jgi:hypothetical protein